MDSRCDGHGQHGSFVEDPFFIVQLIQQGAQFHVTAVGQSTMQADVFFTDAPRINPVAGGKLPDRHAYLRHSGQRNIHGQRCEDE